MRLANAVDRLDSGGTDVPHVITIEQPFAYDELTEVKTGGVLAMAVYWPEDQGRTMIAVAPNHRQKGLGRLLLKLVAQVVGYGQVTLWVGRTNLAGHKLAINEGLFPTALSPTGAVRYGNTTLDADEEAEEGEVERMTNRLNRAGRQRSILRNWLDAPEPAPAVAYDLDVRYDDAEPVRW